MRQLSLFDDNRSKKEDLPSVPDGKKGVHRSINHKAELKALKKEFQQTITMLKEQISQMEVERTELRSMINQAALTKQCDDADIIRQQNLMERLEGKIKELETLRPN